MKIKMTLLSDTIFGSGISEPGGADISVLTDESGFPYYKAGTFKGVFREALEQYLDWTIEGEEKDVKIQAVLSRLLGTPGADEIREDKLVFSDFCISEKVKSLVLEELGKLPPEVVTGCLTHRRTFTSITEDGVAAVGTLRSARCVNRGLSFYSTIQCSERDERLIRDVLPMIKWIGTMRNRGFGKVSISVIEEGK